MICRYVMCKALCWQLSASVRGSPDESARPVTFHVGCVRVCDQWGGAADSVSHGSLA